MCMSVRRMRYAKKGPIRVYKVMEKLWNKRLASPFESMRLTKIVSTRAREEPGYHFFFTRTLAERYATMIGEPFSRSYIVRALYVPKGRKYYEGYVTTDDLPCGACRELRRTKE